jgi:hypothetical protein
VPSIARWDDAQLIQVKLRYRVLGQRKVRDVRRVKRTAKDA